VQEKRGNRIDAVFAPGHGNSVSERHTKEDKKKTLFKEVGRGLTSQSLLPQGERWRSQNRRDSR